MAGVTERKENDSVPRQMRLWIMGDGTTKAALKGSPRGRRQSRQPDPGTPAHHRGTGRRSHGLAPCPPKCPCSSLRHAFTSSSGGPGRGFFCRASVFCRDSFRARLESDLAGATLLPGVAAVTTYTRNIWPEDCSKSDTCLQRKNVEIYISDMKK